MSNRFEQEVNKAREHEKLGKELLNACADLASEIADKGANGHALTDKEIAFMSAFMFIALTSLLEGAGKNAKDEKDLG